MAIETSLLLAALPSLEHSSWCVCSRSTDLLQATIDCSFRTARLALTLTFPGSCHRGFTPYILYVTAVQASRSMPPARTHNAQGRQKSCSQCVKGKRKCDTGQPRCARCSRRGLSCVYPQQPSQQRATPTLDEFFNQHDEAAVVANEPLHSNVALSPFNLVEELHATAPNDQLFDFDLSSAVTSLSSLENLAGTWNDEATMVVPHNFYNSAKPLSFSWADLDSLAKSRVGYAMDQLKLAPKTIVEANATLWSHAALYDEYMPRPMQDAQAACALYNAKNKVNADFVNRHIMNRVEELLVTPIPSAAAEVAAHAHALMLYQIMFVFGGDICLHSHIEALLPHLEEVGSTLLDLCRQEVDPTGTLPLYPSTIAQNAWRFYILRETLRRIVLSLYQFLAICHLLLGRRDTCAPDLARGHTVTLSAHLWRAGSAFDFAVAWNTKKHFVVRDLDFTEVLRDAQPDDVDEFGKTMLVGLQGVDDVKGWFYTRGGTF